MLFRVTKVPVPNWVSLWLILERDGALVLQRIRQLQHDLGMSDAQLLALARWTCGCTEIRCIEELLPVEQDEVLTELLRALYEQRLPEKAIPG